jgi:Tfp pilus assembly protein PilZ
MKDKTIKTGGVDVKKEKRRYSRKALRIEARYQDKNRRVLKGTVRNISIGGIYVETSRPLECGELVHISLDAKDVGRMIDVQGKVVRSIPDKGMGIEFFDKNNRDVKSLLSAMRKLDQASMIALSRSAFEM